MEECKSFCKSNKNDSQASATTRTHLSKGVNEVKAGLPKIGWHSFRHTVSAWRKEAGFTLEEVKTLLRHKNIATTSQVYGAPQMEAKRELQWRLVDFVKQRAEQEGWKPEKDVWVECPTMTTSVQ